MSNFQGMEELLQDFLVEASDLLSDVDNKLVELEKAPQDRNLLNDIFRGFHTIKGGAGFLSANELVTLCHLTENLFDKLRNGEIELEAHLMDVILASTACVKHMFRSLEQMVQPPPAPEHLIARLRDAIAGKPLQFAEVRNEASPSQGVSACTEPDWKELLESLTGAEPVTRSNTPNIPSIGRRESDSPAKVAVASGGGRRGSDKTKEASIRVDTTRLDQVLNLSGEIGLTKNRLNALKSEILSGNADPDLLHDFDAAVSQLDLLVSDLQNAVMKTRMQPVGRLFQKYPRIARDLARNLGKDVELVLSGEETEIDKTMIEDLGDPIIHLIRNAVDHGVESAEERLIAGKPEKSKVRLEARQDGDHIVISVSDDGKGMNAERLRAKAVEKGLISQDEASSLDERHSYNLVFLPGFSTADQISDVSGRGVGMDVVRTNIQKLNGTIDIHSTPGKGTAFVISLPLTLAILSVLVVRVDEQPFAVPLSMVREILPIRPEDIQEVAGNDTLVVRGEVLPIYSLPKLVGWEQTQVPACGVLMQTAERAFILGVDTFDGREDAVIKSLEDFRPKGVAGVTTLANGQIVLIMDMKELLESS